MVSSELPGLGFAPNQVLFSSTRFGAGTFSLDHL